MENSDVVSWLKKQKAEIRIIIASILNILFFIIIYLINMKLGIHNSDFIVSSVKLFALLSFGYILLPQLRCILKYDLIKSSSVKIILIPIVTTFFLHAIITFIRFIPLIFGDNIVQIGTMQAPINYPEFSLLFFLYGGLFPALSEELVFRFIGFQGLKIFIEKYILNSECLFNKAYRNKIISILVRAISFIPHLVFEIIEYFYNQLFLKNNKIILFIWVIISSTLFSLAHGPNILSFYMYFIPGVLYAFLYLRYGLVSSVIAHCIGNYLSPVTWSLAMFIFKSIFPQIML